MSSSPAASDTRRGWGCDDAGVDEPDQVARDAAAMLRRLLDAVERGDLTAGTPQANALVRRIEGAAAALDAVVESVDRDIPDVHPGRPGS